MQVLRWYFYDAMILDKYKNAKIEILDSRSNCMQMGFAAIVAAREGKILDVVKEKAKNNIRLNEIKKVPRVDLLTPYKFNKGIVWI